MSIDADGTSLFLSGRRTHRRQEQSDIDGNSIGKICGVHAESKERHDIDEGQDEQHSIDVELKFANDGNDHVDRRCVRIFRVKAKMSHQSENSNEKNSLTVGGSILQVVDVRGNAHFPVHQTHRGFKTDALFCSKTFVQL